MDRIARQKFGVALLSIVIAVVILLPFPSAAEEVVLRIGGTGTSLGTMKVLADAFQKSHPTIKVVVMPSIGSGGAIRAVPKGSLAVGLISRALTVEEKQTGLSATEYAKTPFVPVVQSDITITDVATADLEKMYRGETQTWPNGERIRLVVRPQADADTTLLRTISPGMDKAVDIAWSRDGMLRATTDQDNTDMLEKTPGAFGFSTLTQMVTEKSRLKMLSLNGIQPSLSALAQGSYPLAKTLSILTVKDPSPPVRMFRDFVLSSEGRAILEKTGNIPVTARTGR
jgi:phosphate transport system substrate-binding protein